MIDLKKIGSTVDGFRSALTDDVEEMNPGDCVRAICRVQILITLLAVSELIPGMATKIITGAFLAAVKLPVSATSAREKLIERDEELADMLDAFFDDGDEDDDDSEPEVDTTEEPTKA